MKYRAFFSFALLFGLLTTAACGHLLSSDTSMPATHPEALGEGVVTCSECHDGQAKGVMKPYASFDHTPVFVKNHRFNAEKDSGLCAVCHKVSFCNDCHANKLEIKPSIKLGNRPDRELVHRGDFLTRHKIEGKIDPVSCYRCHGRTNNELCTACHR